MRITRIGIPAIVAGTVVATVAVTIPLTATAAVRYVALGARNSTTATTTITNSAGTPLALNAKSGSAPLAVNSSKVVSKLNADYVDGVSASAFARTAGKTGVILGEGVTGATCPAGTVLTGGGGIASTAAGDPSALAYSGPTIDATGLVANSWLALPVNAADTVFSFAVCYNPKGAVPGALSQAAVAKLASKAPAVAKLLARTSR
jgi:hypothetical protein